MPSTRPIPRLALLAALAATGLALAAPKPAAALYNRSKIQGLPADSVGYFNACVTMSHFFETQSAQESYRATCCAEAGNWCYQDCLDSIDETRANACELACQDAYDACREGAYVDAEGDADSGYFPEPVVEAISPSPRVDFCLDGETGCGAPAAHEFCRLAQGEGWIATEFGLDGAPASLEDPTWQLGAWYPRQPYGTGQGFGFIQCEASAFQPSLEDVPGDGDLDGIADDADNCPTVPNPLQRNADGDAYGDYCDPEPEVVYACSNGVDDDGDGPADEHDPGCTGYDDDGETETTLVCDNGLDDDGDGATDTADAECTSPLATSEAASHCADGLDDDGDGLVDGDDPGCSSWDDRTEYGDPWTEEFGAAYQVERICVFGGLLCTDEYWSYTEAPYSRHLADVDGDGRADVVAFGYRGVQVALSTGAGFAPGALWSEEFDRASFAAVDLAGERSTRFVRDVDGNGRADLVVFHPTRVLVARSTGAGFAPSEVWSDGGDLGTDRFPSGRDVFLEDVNRDGRPDLVLFDESGTVVSLHTGGGFGPTSHWSPDLGVGPGPFYRNDRTRHMGDLDGDGIPDLVAYTWTETWTARGTGTGFEPARIVIDALGYDTGSNRGRLLTDLDGDGRDDLVAIDDIRVHVLRDPLGPDPVVETWLSNYGAWGRFGRADVRLAADLNGDDRGDLLMTDAQGVSVWHSNGTGFEPRTLLGYGMTDGPDESWSLDFTPRALADVDGDGARELVGFGEDGVLLGELGAAHDPIPVPEPTLGAGLASGALLLAALARRRDR